MAVSRSIKTGVVMLNMGGPSCKTEVGPFLRRLFSDGEIIGLGRFQSIIGPFIADRRTPRIIAQYESIGGGSPIREWTRIQGVALSSHLDLLSPSSAPHRCYTAFRYADPLTGDALAAMRDDGVERAIAFSQYPQFSCTTSGSSLNHLWRELKRMDLSDAFLWSVIDRWPDHEGYIASTAECVREGLAQIPEGEARDQAVIVFSSHSLPLKVVAKGDPYPQEMAATVMKVMRAFGDSHSYVHAWQSKVGVLPWISPSTKTTLQGLGRRGHRHVVVVPIGFTSENIETLYELDMDYAAVAKEAGIVTYARAPAPNAMPNFIKSMGDLVATHIRDEELCTKQYDLHCAHCINPQCRSIVNPIKPLQYRPTL